MKNIRATPPKKNSNEEKLLSFLQEVSRAPASLDGIRTLEGMRSKAENLPGLFQIAERCFNALPGVLQFPGFVSLITHNAVSKFISFAISWRYTGKGYEPPGGMSAPFSGYDEIINSLMGHPRCKAEMEKQARLWEKAHE